MSNIIGFLKDFDENFNLDDEKFDSEHLKIGDKVFFKNDPSHTYEIIGGTIEDKYSKECLVKYGTTSSSSPVTKKLKNDNILKQEVIVNPKEGTKVIVFDKIEDNVEDDKYDLCIYVIGTFIKEYYDHYDIKLEDGSIKSFQKDKVFKSFFNVTTTGSLPNIELDEIEIFKKKIIELIAGDEEMGNIIRKLIKSENVHTFPIDIKEYNSSDYKISKYIPTPLKTGDRVFSNFRNQSVYYMGKITNVSKNYTILYYDGDKEVVSQENIVLAKVGQEVIYDDVIGKIVDLGNDASEVTIVNINSVDQNINNKNIILKDAIISDAVFVDIDNSDPIGNDILTYYEYSKTNINFNEMDVKIKGSLVDPSGNKVAIYFNVGKEIYRMVNK